MTGRYDRSEVCTYTATDTDTGTDGATETVTYLAPRILPMGSTTSSGTQAVVGAAEVARPDLVAFRTLQQPLLAYAIADASDAMDLIGLCPSAGAAVTLPKAAP